MRLHMHQDGPRFTVADFKQLQEDQLMAWFTRDRLVVKFDVLVADNSTDSPVNLDDI